MFEWDEAKSRKLQAERGASFEDLVEAIAAGHTLVEIAHPSQIGQTLLIVRRKETVWVVITERRAQRIRLVTAYPSRKWKKKYG